MLHHVTVVARAVRITVLALLAILLVGVVALHAFMSQYGMSTSTVLLDAHATDAGLTKAVAAQEAAGLRCSETPSLTDVVLFQPLHSSAIEVLTFDQAVGQAATGAGWVRSYCR